jgi:hypothetical protein
MIKVTKAAGKATIEMTEKEYELLRLILADVQGGIRIDEDDEFLAQAVQALR